MNDVVQYNSNADKPISLTDAAVCHLLKYLCKSMDYKGVRFSVKKTGCSGLSYVVDYVSHPEDTDIVEILNEQYNVYIDKSSYPYLKGMRIDYITQGLNSKLVFNNPNQTGQCGCGESFTVDS